MFGRKKTSSTKLDYSNINSLVNVSKKCVDILFVLLIFVLVFVIGKLLVDWGILRAFKTLIKIISPLFIGFVIAWLLNPIVDFFEKKGLKRGISSFIVFFLFLILLVLFFYLLIPAIGKQIQDAIGMVPNVLDSFNKWFDNFFNRLSNLYNYDFSQIKNNIYSSLTAYSNNITEDLPNFIITIVTNLISGGVTFVISLFIAFYMLFDFKNIRKFMVDILPNRMQKSFIDLTDRLDDSLKNYVLGTLSVTLILFLFQSLGFIISGLKAPLVFGIICAITNIIPYVGPYIGGIPAVLVGFTMSPIVGIFTLISVLISQFLESYILTPIILSKTMKLHPVTIIVGLLIFEHFFGILGMLISTPVISCLKIILMFFEEKYKVIQKIKK